MQTGRQYPQILERWLNPDLPITRHAPLRAKFAFNYTIGLLNRTAETDWLDVNIDLAGGGYYYFANVVDLYVHYFEVDFYLAAPVDPGLVIDFTLEDAAHKFWVGEVLSGDSIWHWEVPPLGDGIQNFVETLYEGGIKATVPYQLVTIPQRYY